MTTKQTSTNILKITKAVRKNSKNLCLEGSTIVDINWGLPTVNINLPENKKYFFQGEEASNLLAEAVETSNKFNVSIEDVLLWVSQSWG